MFKKLEKTGQKFELKKIVKSDESFTISHIAPITSSQLSLLILADANVNIDVTIDRQAVSSNCHLDIKMVGDKSKVTIKPNFTVQNSSSKASHAISTLTFADESIFYANCRGLSEKHLKATTISGLIKAYES